MAKKIYDEKISKSTDWGGDESTGGLPVAGGRIQEYLKEQLDGKAGIFHYDTSNNRYLVFADADTRDEYLADPTKTGLLLGTFDAPFNYSAEITLSSPAYKAILSGTKNNYIYFTFDTKNKSGQSVGEDVVATYTFIRNGVKKTVTERYRYGTAVHFGIDDYIETGTNNIMVGIVGQNTLAATTVGITYQVIDLQLSGNYDVSAHYNLMENPAATAAIPYRISGYGTKVMEWYLDGVLLDYVKVEDEIVDVSTSRTKYISLSNLNQGRHSLQLRAYTMLDGEKFYSDAIYYDLIVYTGADREPIIGVSAVIPSGYDIIKEGGLQLYGIQQYIPYMLDFSVYNPSGAVSTDAVVSVDGKAESTLATHNNEVVNYSLRPLDYGLKSLTITAGNTVYAIGMNIEKSSTSLEDVRDGLVLDLSAIGKSNNDANRQEWVYGLFSASFSGFYWNRANGWVNNRLLITGGAAVDVNIAPFTPDPTITGRTLEFEFATRNVLDDDAVICDLRNEAGTGLLITASEASLTSAGGSRVAKRFNSGENKRISFVINPKNGVTNKGLVFIYVDGISSGSVNYSGTDNFLNAKTMRIGGTGKCDVELKSLRFYNSPLDADQILNNFILYRDTPEELLSLYDRNNIYEDGTRNFSVDKLAAQCPVFIFTGDIPALENTTDKNKAIYVDVEYINMQETWRSFTGKAIRLTPQGTSSMGFPKKNLRPYTGYGEVWDNMGKIMVDGLYAFKEGAQPVNVWCLKADYAESSGTHNTGIARLWNEVMYNAQVNGEYVLRTEAQKAALANNYPYDVRTTVDGFPCNVFYRLTPDSELVYMGKYNFNNDKSTESVFGFRDIPGFDNSRMQCWEVLNNGNHLALFQDVDNFDAEWKEAYEARYPDKSTNVADLKAFSEWVVSTKDNVEKFKAEKWDHLDVYKTAAYYIYLMRFAAVDQPVKNAMLTSEDGEHFFFINYDNDTINALRNDGPLKYAPDIDRQTIDTDYTELVYAFAGHDSTLWNNLEADDEFMRIVSEVDNALYIAGLTYEKSVDMFDNKQASKWCERIYNQDAQYKYIGPYTDSGINNLFMLQGSRSSHRKWWLGRRFDLYDSKFVSGAYKAKSIEFKAANAPAGLTFSVTSGNKLYYGYGINNVAVETGIHLNPGESTTFTSRQVINVGDPVRIYSAPNVQELDLHNFIPYLSTVNIAEVYGQETGTKLKKLVLGVDTAGDTRRNTSLSVISGLSSARQLEYLDISGYKGITGIELSDHIYLRTFKAFESGLTGLSLSDSLISTLELPASLQTLQLDSLEYLSTGLKISEGGRNLNNILIRNCTKFDSRSFLFTWNNVRETEDSLCNIRAEGITWNDVNVGDLLKLAAIRKNGGNLVLKGRIKLKEVNESQLTELLSIFGNEVTNPDNELYINAPDGVFITGPTTVLQGDTVVYKASVFSENPGRVEYCLVYDGKEILTTGSITINKETGEMVSVESPASVGLLVRARHFPTAGAVVFKDLPITVLARVYPTSGSFSGKTSLNSTGDFSWTLDTLPVNETGRYHVEWEVSGQGAEDGYVELKECVDRICTVAVKSVPVDLITFNLRAKLIREHDNNNFLNVSQDIQLLIPGVIMTKTSNPEVLDVCYHFGWAADENYMTEIEAASVSSLAGAFKDNKKIRHFDEFQYFTGVTAIETDAFCNCGNLKSIILPDSIKSIGSSAFFKSGIEELVIPDGVSLVNASFAYMYSLKKIVLPIDLVDIPSNLFKECSSLESIDLPPNIKNIDVYAFTNAGIKNIVLPESLETLAGSAFQNMYYLTSVYIGGKASITGVLFQNCPALETITVSSDNKVYSSVDGVLFSGSELLRYPPAKENIEYVIPSHITSIGEYAFQNAKVEHVDLSNIEALGKYAFQYSNIEEVILERVQSMGGYVFSDCSKLANAEIMGPVSIFLLTTFFRCSALKQAVITVPDAITEGTFMGCSLLQDVILENVKGIGAGTFRGCKALKELSIPASVTIIGEYAFFECVKMGKLYINRASAPTLESGVFGSNWQTYTGKDNPPGTNILYVPEGATGYDEGQWLDPLQAEDKCKFTISYTL